MQIDLEAAVRRDLAAHMPENQQECFEAAARVAALLTGTMNPEWLGTSSRALARGLLGHAYAVASEQQKHHWHNMATAALRKAHGLNDQAGK